MPNKRPPKTAAAAKRARGSTAGTGSARSADASAALESGTPAGGARPGAARDRETPRRAQPNADLEADLGESEGLITMVCITCGAEQFFDDAVPPALTCTRCTGIVFRGFATPAVADEATIDQLESVARSIQYGDSSPQTTADDERELDFGG